MPKTATITFSPGELEVHVVALAHEPRQLVAAVAGAAHVDREPQRVVVEHARGAGQPLVEHVEPGQLAHRRPRGGQRRGASPSSSSCPRTAALRRAASSEPAEERAGARGLDQRHAAVHDLLVDQVAVAEVDHRRLGEAAHDLVGARDHEVGAERERVPRQRVVEGQVRAPGLVHDQRHAVGVGHLGQPGDVRHRAEVGGRHDGRPDRARGLGRARARAPPGVMQWAMCSSRVELGRHERGPQPGEHERVDRARVRVALDDHLATAVGEREQRHVVALRRAVHQEPGAPGAPGLGGQDLGLLERRGLGAHVDAVGERRDVERQRAPARARRAAPGRRPARPCAPARGSAPGRARRRRAARPGTACRTADARRSSRDRLERGGWRRPPGRPRPPRPGCPSCRARSPAAAS